jgi:flagellar protein FlbD
MVILTRFDGNPIVVNAEMIETVESTPDTILTLTNGRKLLVKEGLGVVVDRVIDYRRRTLERMIYFSKEDDR